MIIPNIWENKKCSKPPTRCEWEDSWFLLKIFHAFPQQSIFNAAKALQFTPLMLQLGTDGLLPAAMCLLHTSATSKNREIYISIYIYI